VDSGKEKEVYSSEADDRLELRAQMKLFDCGVGGRAVGAEVRQPVQLKGGKIDFISHRRKMFAKGVATTCGGEKSPNATQGPLVW